MEENERKLVESTQQWRSLTNLWVSPGFPYHWSYFSQCVELEAKGLYDALTKPLLCPAQYLIPTDNHYSFQLKSGWFASLIPTSGGAQFNSEKILPLLALVSGRPYLVSIGGNLCRARVALRNGNRQSNRCFVRCPWCGGTSLIESGLHLAGSRRPHSSAHSTKSPAVPVVASSIT